MNAVCTFPFPLANRIRIKKCYSKINVRCSRSVPPNQHWLKWKAGKVRSFKIKSPRGNLNIIRPVHRDFNHPLTPICGPGSSVGITTELQAGRSGIQPGGDEIFRPSRPALGPTQPPVKWVPGLSRRQSAAEACCWPLTPSSAAIMQE